MLPPNKDCKTDIAWAKKAGQTCLRSHSGAERGAQEELSRELLAGPELHVLAVDAVLNDPSSFCHLLTLFK